MNDKGKRISILKLDVEGFEFRVLPSIVESGILDSIHQITLEMHAEVTQIPQSLEDIKSILDCWKIMQSKGFRIVDYSPNLTLERSWKLSNYGRNYRNFDITFIKHS